MSIKLTLHSVTFSYEVAHLPDYSSLVRAVFQRYGHTISTGQPLVCSYYQNDKINTIEVSGEQGYQQILKKGDIQIKLGQRQASFDKTEKEDSSETIIKILSKYKVNIEQDFQRERMKNWQKDDWIKFIKHKIRPQNQQQFKDQIFTHFKQQNHSRVNFSAKTLNKSVIKEIQAQGDSVQRYPHSQDAVFSFFLSHYEEEVIRQGLSIKQNRKKCWKIHKWRVINSKISQKTERQDFSIKKTHERLIPTFHIAYGENKQKSKVSLLFPKGTLTADQIAQQYHLHDKIYTGLALHATSPVTQEQSSNINSWFRSYSDYDIQFATGIFSSFIQYASGGLKYISPSNDSDGILPQFEDNQLVGLLGDWGTGLRDAQDLLDELVIKKRVSIVLHLGDVYHSGKNYQFKRIVDKISQLRGQYPNLRYYAIPGNHDYYTFGGPYLEHLTQINHPTYLQKFSFFCLRNKSRTVQYIGVDTGSSDYNFTNIFNPLFEGTYVQQKECEWAIRRINEFKGKTVFISHHPLFSSFQSQLGAATQFGFKNPQINYKLSEQFFEVQQKISVWYWGHQHRFTQYTDSAYGGPKCRLLGNSAFQNNQDNFYDIKYGDKSIAIRSTFPERTIDKYYNHTAAVFSNHNNPELLVHYIETTCSYDKPSRRVKEFSELINKPVKEPIRLKQIYGIKQQSGLSISVANKEVLLNNVASAVRFHQADNPQAQGLLTSKVEYLIEFVNSGHYLYYSSWGLVACGDYDDESASEKKKYRWRFQFNTQNPQTKDTFTLYSSYRKSRIGREHYVTYFSLSAASVSKFQIYVKGKQVDLDEQGASCCVIM